MKITSLFLASTALPLMLMSANASALPPQAAETLTVAQAEPAEPGQLPPRARPGRDGGDESPRRRQGRPSGNEEGGPRGQRGGNQGGAPEAPRAPRAVNPDDGPATPRPNRDQRPPAERPARPSAAPTERAQPPAEAPARPGRPSSQERERAPAERPRSQQAPDTPAHPAVPSPSQEQRSAPSAPRPAENGRPNRDDPRTPSAPPSAPRPSAAEQPTPPAPVSPPPAAPQAQPTLPAPTPPASVAPQAQPDRPAPGAAQRTAPREAQPLDPSRVRIDDLRRERRERREGGRLIIEEPGNRTIIREGNDVIIRHDETERFRRIYGPDDVRVERRGGNEEVTIVRRPDGSEIISVRDEYGNLIRRVRREPAGREIILIENRRRGIDIRPGYGYVEEEVLRLPPPRVTIPRERYIVETERASEADIIEAFTAPPVERIERAYTLDEVRRSRPLRERMRRVDLDTINFDFGSWELPRDQVDNLAVIAQGLREAISRNPNEIFLVEGHTDAVGSNEDNLTLSDRRAETVATILSQQFQIPAENLTTQGYGEEYLKVETQGPEQENRRVTLRRITPLLQGQNQQ